MTSRKKTGIIAGVGVGAAAAAALRRRWSRGGPAEEPPPINAPADAASERFIETLARAISIPTVAGADAAFDDLRRLLEEAFPGVHALPTERFGEHTLLFEWPGSDPSANPVMLMAHQDVVAADQGEWESPPFSGERRDGYLWGRGALDDKGPLVGILQAVEGLLAEGFQPVPTVYLLFGHDEETGGRRGAAAVADAFGERGTRLAFVLDEGGAVVSGLVPGLAPLALIGVAEKASVDVVIEAQGDGGHSSMPPSHTAVGRVAAAVSAVEERPMPPRLDVQRQLLEAIAEALRGPRRWMLRNLDWSRPVVERRLALSPATNALIRTTAAATVIEGGSESNVLPQRSRAIINFRVLPGDTVADVLNHVRAAVGDGVSVSLRGAAPDPAAPSSTDGAGYRIVSSVIGETFPGVAISPWVVPGATDSRYFVPVSDGVYRFTPLRLGPGDLSRFHGVDERLAEVDAPGVVAFYRRLITRAGGVA